MVQTAQREAALEATMAAAAAAWSERRLLLTDPAGVGDAVLADPACLQALQTLAAEQVRALVCDTHCACRSNERRLLQPAPPARLPSMRRTRERCPPRR